MSFNKPLFVALLAGSAAFSPLAFATNDIQVQQVLAVRPDGGKSGMPLRPDW